MTELEQILDQIKKGIIEEIKPLLQENEDCFFFSKEPLTDDTWDMRKVLLILPKEELEFIALNSSVESVLQEFLKTYTQILREFYQTLDTFFWKDWVEESFISLFLIPESLWYEEILPAFSSKENQLKLMNEITELLKKMIWKLSF